MDNNFTIAIIIIFLVCMSAYFSATETAFSSLNRIRIKNLASNGNKKAKSTLDLVENYDMVLSTILIGNNIINILSTSLATLFFTNIFGKMGVTISTIVMTILVLIFGEISPKSLAKEIPESLAMFSTPFLKFFITILKPINYIFGLWKELLYRFVNINNDEKITEDELLTIIDEAQNEGGINEQEGELIRSAIEFNDLDVRDVLTPRVDVVAINIEDDNDQIDSLFTESGYSRLPVYKESIDNIIGVLHEKNFNIYLKKGAKGSLVNILKPVIFVTPTMKISRLLKLLQQYKTHMAIVTDEYGGTVGIVTLEDILEELVGEIWDEHDEIIEEFVKIGENEYRISCSANIDKMFDLFGIDRDYDANTVSGFVIQELGKIPEQGDHFIYENLDITVTKTDGRRVLEIHVKVLPSKENKEE
ncbi:HlyC/CorC family transporter [Garciella nitratireducens]|uniref:HlyC/CorC family transporter n=1 Tax=Garciella nitratireducens TaxID=218205 RepID=UPI001BD61692|nr:hemolysin family protein [Garciella nitratireducens]